MSILVLGNLAITFIDKHVAVQISKITYGLYCLKENCVYVFYPEEVKNIYTDVFTMKVSVEEVQRFKNEIGHQETTDLDIIGDGFNDFYCMKYFDDY